MEERREELERILLTVDGQGEQAKRKALYEYVDLMLRRLGEVQKTLDSIPGAHERHQQGKRDAREGRVTDLERLGAEINEGLQQARRGDFVSGEEVRDRLRRKSQERRNEEETLRRMFNVAAEENVDDEPLEPIEHLDEWLAEIERRVEGFRRGEVELVAGEEVFRKAFESLRERSVGEGGRILYLSDRQRIAEVISHRGFHLERIDHDSYYLSIELFDGSYAQIDIRSDSAVTVICYSHTPAEFEQAGWTAETQEEDEGY